MQTHLSNPAGLKIATNAPKSLGGHQCPVPSAKRIQRDLQRLCNGILRADPNAFIEPILFLTFLGVAILGGLSVVKVVRAQSQDGRVFRSVGTHYHITGKADPAYYRDFNRPGLTASGGQRDGLTKPYKESVWVMAAINLVTQPIKAVTLKAYSGETEFQNANLAAFFRRPAVGLSYAEFIDATAGWWKLRGRFFWILDDTWLTRSARKSPIIVARPDSMKPIKSGDELVGWEYSPNPRTRIPLIPEQVITQKRWNPYNPEEGLGELDAALLAAATDHAASKFAYDTFANSGDQGDYIIAKGAMPTEEQRAQIIAAVREKRLARSRGEFRPALLAGDFDISNPSITAPDAAFAANRIQNRHEIFAAFGVPLSMADVQASYSIGSASDWFRLIQGTCIPLAKTIADSASILASRFTGQSLECEFDWDEHPTMQAVRAERVDSAAKLFAFGMPVREINDYLDMGLPEFPGWEIGYLPFSVSPVGSSMSDPAPETTPTPPADPVAAMLRALTEKASACPCGHDHSGEITAKAPGKLWQKLWQARQSSIRVYASKFNKQLMAARSTVLSKIEKAGKTRAVAADFLFDLEEWQKGLLSEMRKAGIATMDTAGKQLFAEIAKDDVFTMPAPKALEFLLTRENKIKDLASDIFDTIKGSLEQGLTDGETMSQLANRVRAEFNGISKGRALTIAQTETAAAYGYSRNEAMTQAGIEYKQWLTSGNENVRDTHRAAEGQTVPLNAPFRIGSVNLMYPGDPNGPAEEVINCHCIQIAVRNPENEDNA